MSIQLLRSVSQGKVCVNTRVLSSLELTSQPSIFSLDQIPNLLYIVTYSFSSSAESHNYPCLMYSVVETLHVFSNVFCQPSISSSCGYFNVSSPSFTMLESTHQPLSQCFPICFPFLLTFPLQNSSFNTHIHSHVGLNSSSFFPICFNPSTFLLLMTPLQCSMSDTWIHSHVRLN